MTVSPTALTKENAATERAERLAKTGLYYAIFVALGLAAAVLGPTLPGLAAHTRASISEISFIFPARSLGYLLGSLQAGWLFDRMRGHPLLAFMLGILALTLIIVPLVSWLAVLAFVVLFLGVAEGTLDAGGNTLLVWVHRRQMGPFMNALHFFFGLGAFLAPMILAQAIALSGDVSWAYWTVALLALPAIPFLLRLPSPRHGEGPHAEKAVPIDLVLLALLTLFFFLYVGAEGSFGGWIFTYTTALGLSSQEAAAYLTSAFWGALTVGRFLGIPIAARFSPKSILLVDLVAGIISVLVILFWNNSLAAVWIGTLGAGLSFASIFPTLLSFAERRLTITASVSSWFFVGAGLGGLMLLIIGQLFETVGPLAVMYCILVDLALLLTLYTILILYSNRRTLKE